jgi:hypothetical protein
MISFRHGHESVVLQSGDVWAPKHDGDSYRDTAADTLLTIVGEVERGIPWRAAVASHYAESNPWLHQIITSPARDLFFRQHPPPAGARILDLGSGWGQIALPLARRPDSRVTALEPTGERLAFIRAAATQERLAGRMCFVQADFLDLEFEPSFDLICCIGVLEWVPKFRSGEPRSIQLDFLRRIRGALRPQGKCFLGIENRLGLKYLLGSKDDHTSQGNVSVFEAALAAAKHRAITGEELRVFTYTYAEYETLFREAGFEGIETHAAFPDYKLPELILPFANPPALNQTLLDKQIPPEHDGVTGQRLGHPEEYVSHYRSVARMGLAQYFCPSFYFILQ